MSDRELDNLVSKDVQTLVHADRLFTGSQWLSDQVVLIANGYIVDIVPADQCLQVEGDNHRHMGSLVPGFIDVQVNGGGGVMFNTEPSAKGLEAIAAAHRGFGTTAMMPTLISDTEAVLQAGAAAITAVRAGGHQGVLGLHIEGPHFNLVKRGAHRKSMIRAMQQEDLEWLVSLQDFPLMVTLAPELLEPDQLAELVAAGVRVCAGHTDASYDDIQAALAQGLCGFTHLFNAMSPFTSREPGVVGAAVDDEDSWVGVIADGHHVHPASLRVAHRAKAAGKMMLVSDAMPVVGGDDDSFEIYGESISVQDGKLVNAQGALAGSAIGLIDAVRVCHTQVGLELEECLRMASLYPAAFLGMESVLGQIAPGFRADMVLLDDALQVLDTWVAGEHEAHLRSSS